MVDSFVSSRLLQDEAETEAPEPEPVSPDDTAVLVNTLLIYGSLFVIIWLLFCWLRLKYPKVYNVRGWVKEIHCKLATNQFSFFSWIFELNEIHDKQIMEQCGMDALCLLKALSWAFKVAAVSAFNALWLIPVYGSAKGSPETDYITDYIASITVSHIPPGSQRLIATTIATYIVFLAALYFLYQDFEWFRNFRFRYLHQSKPQNYTVYVQGINDEYKSDYDLAEYFQESFGLGRVQEAHLKLATPELLDITMKRKALVAKLEHAINVLEVEKTTPTHKVGGVEVNSIDAYADELKELNREITERIEYLEVGGYDSDDTEAQMMESKRHDEGKPLDGGFVTFYNLSSTQAARQMNHARMPFEMMVLEAPDPEEILWSNVGKNHKEIQVGTLVSIVLTATICLLWTIPISFFSGMSNIEGLEEQSEFIKEANENVPALRAILAQVAPFLVVIVNSLLPVILKALSIKECHIGNGMIQASLFSKLALFAVVQTFFVAAISGSIISQLSTLSEDPASIIEILANELPTKSTFFIQLIFISTVLGLGMELLRVVPVIMASLRGCLGPNLTEKERNSPWLFFNPLSVPPVFNHASVLANLVFFCMILFVYAALAPLTSIFLVIAFLILASGYRHQLVYIYPPKQESGGRLWMNFVGIILNCMLVAQITIVALLGLKEGAIAAPLAVPIIPITMLFKAYIYQRHFQSMECLPSHECHKKDASSDFYITESFEDLYVQPELLVKEAFPENISSKLRKKISLLERKKTSSKKKKRRKKESSVSKTANTEPPQPAVYVEREEAGTPPASI